MITMTFQNSLIISTLITSSIMLMKK